MHARRNRRYGGESSATVYLPKRACRLQSERSEVSGHARASVARIPALVILIGRHVISPKPCRAPNARHQDANLPDEGLALQAGAMTRNRAPCAAHPRTRGSASIHDPAAGRCAVACDRPTITLRPARSIASLSAATMPGSRHHHEGVWHAARHMQRIVQNRRLSQLW